MKTNNQLVVCITIVLLFTTKNLVAQVSTGNNFGAVGNYVGWQLNQNLNLDIVNEDRYPIKFYTDGGAGSGGMWNNLRMFIQGNDGNVGIGNFTTANTLLHLHQVSDVIRDVNFQMTNASIGNTVTDGFLVDVNTSGRLRLNQQERAPMEFWGIDATLSNSNINRGEWTYGNAMQENQLSPTDGFRIWNPGYSSSTSYNPDHALDLWCGNSNTTHIRFDHSGLIQTINLRFEQIARLNGFWFDARPYDYQKTTGYRGEFYFNIDSIEIGRYSNTNTTNLGFMRIGRQPAGQLASTGVDATRRLEIYDAADVPQFRITRTTDASYVPQVYTDLQTTNFGDFILIPTYNGAPAHVGIGTTTPASPLEIHSPTITSGTQSTMLVKNILGTSTGIKRGIEIEVKGANTQLVALNSSIPSSSATGGTYGWQHSDYNSGATATGAQMDMSGSNTYATGIKLNLTNTNSATGSETYGMYNTVTGGNPAVWGLRLNTNSTSTATGAILYGVSSEINGAGGNQNEVIALRGYNTKSGSTTNYGVAGTAASGIGNIGVYGNAGIGSSFNYGIYGSVISPSCTTGSCSNAAIYANGPGYTTSQWYTSSDASIKKNILPISDYWTVLNGLNGYRYEFDTSLNATTNLNLTPESQMGLLAQEVEAVAPELVRSFINPGSTDSNGVTKSNYTVKSINYDGIIPVLVGAIKDLKAKVDSLMANAASIKIKNNIDNIEENNTNGAFTNERKITLSNQQGIILKQNDPNPFSESTRIRYYIPEEVQDARLIFSSENGIVLKTVQLSESGEGTIEVYASDLSSGLYIYTLMVDGKIIESKKMIKQ